MIKLKHLLMVVSTFALIAVAQAQESSVDFKRGFNDEIQELKKALERKKTFFDNRYSFEKLSVGNALPPILETNPKYQSIKDCSTNKNCHIVIVKDEQPYCVKRNPVIWRDYVFKDLDELTISTLTSPPADNLQYNDGKKTSKRNI